MKSREAPPAAKNRMRPAPAALLEGFTGVQQLSVKVESQTLVSKPKYAHTVCIYEQSHLLSAMICQVSLRCGLSENRQRVLTLRLSLAGPWVLNLLGGRVQGLSVCVCALQFMLPPSLRQVLLLGMTGLWVPHADRTRPSSRLHGGKRAKYQSEAQLSRKRQRSNDKATQTLACGTLFNVPLWNTFWYAKHQTRTNRLGMEVLAANCIVHP